MTKAFYTLMDVRRQLTAHVRDAVRSIVPTMTLDEVFISMDEITGKVKEKLDTPMQLSGFTVLQVLLNKVSPPPSVKAAMNSINAAARLRVAALTVAEAQKATIVKAAEANADALYLSGVGIARQRQAIAHGMCSSIQVRCSEVFFKIKLFYFLDTSTQQIFFLIIKIKFFWGDLSGISAKTATLVRCPKQACDLRSCCDQ